MPKKAIGVRVSGILYTPGKGRRTSTEVIRRARGFGRWVYCKYCGRNVRPALGGIYQVVCYTCGSGLSPDFFRLQDLKRYWPLWKEYASIWTPDHKSAREKDLRRQMNAIIETDENSDRAKEWLRQMEAKAAIERLNKRR